RVPPGTPCAAEVSPQDVRSHRDLLSDCGYLHAIHFACIRWSVAVGDVCRRLGDCLCRDVPEAVSLASSHAAFHLELSPDGMAFAAHSDSAMEGFAGGRVLASGGGWRCLYGGHLVLC